MAHALTVSDTTDLMLSQLTMSTQPTTTDTQTMPMLDTPDTTDLITILTTDTTRNRFPDLVLLKWS